MAIYDYVGAQINQAFDIEASTLNEAFDIDGNRIYTPDVDYSNYSFTQKWESKSVSNTQGFDIYDGKVYWISKSGDSTVPADCYVWNLSDGSQAFENQPITIYSGHGNSLDIIDSKAYAGTAYSPATVYENALSSDLQTFTLSKTFDMSEDISYGHDCCIDENDTTVMWTLAHTGAISDTEAPFLLSKWDLTDLTDNGDGTHSPKLLSSIQTPQPSNSAYFQGMTMHDGMIWYASGYAGSSSQAYVYAISPLDGTVLYSINCETIAEPEGIAFVDNDLYVGFQGMMLRKYTFGTM